jgi:hypothetical protein
MQITHWEYRSRLPVNSRNKKSNSRIYYKILASGLTYVPNVKRCINNFVENKYELKVVRYVKSKPSYYVISGKICLDKVPLDITVYIE